MRVFVTGATGFIGGHLCRRLVGDGHEVTALVRSPHKADALRELGVQLLPGDLGLFADPEVLLPEHDAVVHLAGVVAAQDPEQYEAINYTAVVDLMACLHRQAWVPKRLVFASSLAAAGPSVPGRPWTEDDDLAPIDPYGEAKARAESALRDARFPVTCMRPPIVLGPGDPAFLTLFKAARRGVGVRVAGAPQYLSWVYVDDLVSAMLAMLADERPGHRAYYAASSQQVDSDQLWDALRSALDRRIAVISVPGRVLSLAASVATRVAPVLGLHNQLDHKQVAQMRAPGWQCDNRALRDELGWQDTWEFGEAVAATARGYEALGQL